MHTMTVAPVIKKIPGKPVRFENEKDGFVNLSEMSKLEILDSLQRQNKLLSNEKFIFKLPDKGEKIKKFREKIETELKKREEQDKLCNLISNLSVNESKSALNELEWTGNYNSSSNCEAKEVENESNLLQILATHSGTPGSCKKLLQSEKSVTLVKPTDICTNYASELNVDLYAQHLCHLIDENDGGKLEKKFYPNKSLNKTFTKSISSSREHEISAAYVPKNISGQTKLITLEESIIVHQEQLKHLKEIETQNAVEKLVQKCRVKTKLPTNFISSYREQEQDFENTDDEDTDSNISEENSEEECDDGEKISNLSDVD